MRKCVRSCDTHERHKPIVCLCRPAALRLRKNLRKIACSIRGSSYISKDGFKAAKQKVLAALRNGTYQHEVSRSGVAVKNLLLTGQVTSGDICDLIERSRGQDHSASPHHTDGSILVHVIRREGWYVKFYFLDPDTIFISVHR